MLGFPAHHQAVQVPDDHRSLERTHMPLSHLPALLNAHSCPFPETLASARLCEGMGVHPITALRAGFCLLHGLGCQQTLYPHAPISQYGTGLSMG